MQTKELLSVLEREIAPVSMSDELCSKYGMYDNSGIIFDSGRDIDKILFSLDLSRACLEEASRAGAQCIVTHHPAIFRGIKSILPENPGTAVLADCVRRGVSVVSMHLNFDCAPFGTDYHLMRAAGGEKEDAFLNTVTGGGYGRVYGIEPLCLGELAENLKETLCTSRMMVYGNGGRKISRVASFCGAGGDEEAVAFAAANGAEAFISADMKHHVLAELVQRDICVIELTHYASESYGLRMICERLKNIMKDSTLTFYADESML